MNARQKKKVMEVIKKNPLVKGKYYYNGETCVIGGLLMEAGFGPEKLKKMDKGSSDGGGSAIEQYDWALAKLLEEFGIDEQLAIDLQRLNDESREAEYRRKELLSLVDEQKVSRL